MKKYNKNKNVYEASLERIDYIFKNFERIYISFSGGKDSGIMLNLTLQYMRENNITEKIGLMVMDNEANFNHSLDFMHRIVRSNLDLLDTVKGRYSGKSIAAALREKPELLDDLIETGVLSHIPLTKDIVDILIKEKKLNKVI